MSDHDIASATPARAVQKPAAAPQSSIVPATRSAKIQNEHLDRLALVYVRQSTPHQVLHHHESRERQYALVDRAVALGWSRERVRMIDKDQGHTAKTAEGRIGFQSILTDVTMGHVGLVLS